MSSSIIAQHEPRHTPNRQNVLDSLGNTPVVSFTLSEMPWINVYGKLEYFNPTGSIKARAAWYVLNKGLNEGFITSNTRIIESSSGNFGSALAAYCKQLGLSFTCVIDPNITDYNKKLIKIYDAELEMVTTHNASGNYLQSRLDRVEEICNSADDIYWTNQYKNHLVAEAYHETIGQEICDNIDSLDYAFIGVSSGGTITGLSQKLKSHYPNIKIIAVDSVGSVIFGDTPKKRYIPGIGSSMVPAILKNATIDDVVRVDEIKAINACFELFNEHILFLGGSSGSAYQAVKDYFSKQPKPKDANVLILFPDGGEKYLDTIYNQEWRTKVFGTNI
jgi:cysteine synthase A